ncbi:hypothetical protein GCM10027416_13360 [Okibacterium endophyticum]
MAHTPIYVESRIRADLERVWELTQNPAHHPRWDLRFSAITPVGDLTGGGYRFRYERRIPAHVIVGTGTAIGERSRPDGTRTSALKFATSDRLSPLGAGRGYWRYEPTPTGTTFITGFDYEPAWGALIDKLCVRPVVGWMTAWSFDRLRIWAETGVPPERWPAASVLRFWRRDRPRARRCLREKRRSQTMTGAPSTLDDLEMP